jgi:hypothetical protein
VADNDEVDEPLVLEEELEPPPHETRTKEAITKKSVESFIF